MEAAGWPVMSMGKVNASHWNGATIRPSIFSGPWMCRANGGTASVGVSSRSYVRMNFHILLTTALRVITASVSSSAVHGRRTKSTKCGVICAPYLSTSVRNPRKSDSRATNPQKD